MKISHDTEVDALSIILRETTVTSKPLGEGIAASHDSEGRLAGLEILDAVRRFGGEDTLRQVTFEGLGPGARAPHTRKIPPHRENIYARRILLDKNTIC